MGQISRATVEVAPDDFTYTPNLFFVEASQRILSESNWGKTLCNRKINYVCNQLNNNLPKKTPLVLFKYEKFNDWALPLFFYFNECSGKRARL